MIPGRQFICICCFIKIQGVMRDYEQQCCNQYRREGQPDHESQENHADANSPDDLQGHLVKMEIKTKGKIYQGNFKKNEPASSFDQKKTQFFFRFPQTLKPD